MDTVSQEGCDDDLLRQMALEWYGYGWWEGPFWFVGPEPGRPEKENTLRKRCEAWITVGRGELIDCKRHHFDFGWHNWHRESPLPPTQPTWRQLIRLLLTLQAGDPPTLDAIRHYQQRCWGMRTSRKFEETCVIELSSLASPALGLKKNVAFDPDCFLEERIEVIRRRISEYKPRLVLMYGGSQGSQFKRLANRDLAIDQPVIIGSTCFVRTLAPTARGIGNDYWTELATRLRKLCGSDFFGALDLEKQRS